MFNNAHHHHSNHSDQRNTVIGIAQANLNHCFKAQHEFFQRFLADDRLQVAFICEPYVGKHASVKNSYGLHLHQYPTDSPVRACIVVKPDKLSTLGVTQWSSSNVCAVQANTTHGRIFLTCVYIPPRPKSGSDSSAKHILSRIEAFIRSIPHADHLVCGDFNGWHPSWGSPIANRRGNEVADFCLTCDLAVCNRGTQPTFETVTHGVARESIVDLTLISERALGAVLGWQVDTSICPSSDHHAVRFDVGLSGRISLTRNRKQSTFRYDTTSVKWSRIRDDFTNRLADSLPLMTDPCNLDREGLDEHIGAIAAAVAGVCDELLPRSRSRARRCPWWTDELEQTKKRVIRNHHLIQRLKRRRMPLDEALREKTRLKDEYSKLFNSTSTTHFREFCNKQGKEDVWSVTNRIIKTSPPAQPPATLRCSDGTYTSTTSETAQALLDKFFPDDDPVFDDDVQSQLRRAASEPPATTSDPPFTSVEILDCLGSMNHKKAPGPDHLTADICLELTKSFPNLVTGIMNRCLEIGYFPVDWKEAIIKIIPKPGKDSYSELSAFRPIGLINVMGKLLEKLIIGRLSHLMSTDRTFSENQYGFRAQTSTTHALRDAFGLVTRAKAAGKQVIAISLDIQAAFDNAWWPAIFHRLKAVNCPSNLYMLIVSYLSERRVQMVYADVSQTKQINKGCIQGSVCGPFFWNLIMDELLSTNLPKGCSIQAFADDVLLIVEAGTVSELSAAAGAALRIIHHWGQSVKLTFGPAKTQAIAFTRKALKSSIFLEGHLIKFSREIKLLGIIVDNKLKFIRHAEYISNKAIKIYTKLIQFVRATWGINSTNIQIIYEHVIVPIICYAPSIWAEAIKFQCVRSKLLSLQRGFAIKIIRGFRTISTHASISLAQLTPLPDKVLEWADTERTRLCGTTEFLPDDIKLDVPAHPSELLHPALRKPITHTAASSSEDLEVLMAPEFHQIYTDGSKHDESVGAAMVICKPDGRKIVRKFKLHRSCSVYQAELFAIHEACLWVEQNRISPVYILSDSRSGLEELANSSSHYQLAVKIHRSIHRCEQLGLSILMVWVKAHIGIPGNELADAAAKSAAISHRSPDFASFPLSYVRRIVKSRSEKARGEFYDLEGKCAYTKTICPNFESLKNTLNLIKPDFYTTQMYTNHGYHKEYLHRFKITSDDKCPCDRSTVQSFKHLIADCPRFGLTRQQHEYICITNSVDPYSVSSIVTKEESTLSYVQHVRAVVEGLKDFNNPTVN